MVFGFPEDHPSGVGAPGVFLTAMPRGTGRLLLLPLAVGKLKVTEWRLCTRRKKINTINEKN
jgi:hypothetical protein